MKVKVSVSNRHIHLTKEVYKELFNSDDLEIKRELNQIGEFASNSRVNLEYNGKVIENVIIVGPFRNYNQVELLQSDLDYLGIDAPERKSGDLNNTPGINIINGNKKVTINSGVIKAQRHIHVNTNNNIYDLKEDNTVLIHGPYNDFNAKVKISDNGYYELHIDKEEANLFGLKTDDEVDFEVIK